MHDDSNRKKEWSDLLSKTRFVYGHIQRARAYTLYTFSSVVLFLYEKSPNASELFAFFFDACIFYSEKKYVKYLILSNIRCIQYHII